MLLSDFHCKENDTNSATAEQTHLHVAVSQDIPNSTNSDPDFMNTMITGDMSWVYVYDPETKFQSSMKIRREH